METLLVPYLHFNGNCREVMEFYKSIFGGTFEAQTYGEMPPGMDEGEENKHLIMNSHLKTPHFTIRGSDSTTGVKREGNNIDLCVEGPDQEMLTKAFHGLAEGGEVTVALEKMFWGDMFGMLIDKYGFRWMININLPKDEAAA